MILAYALHLFLCASRLRCLKFRTKIRTISLCVDYGKLLTSIRSYLPFAFQEAIDPEFRVWATGAFFTRWGNQLGVWQHRRANFHAMETAESAPPGVVRSEAGVVKK